MFESRRQHPVAALTKVIDIIKDNFITILIVLFVGGTGDQESLINMTWLLGMIIFLLVWGVLSWMRFKYRVIDGELQIEQGVVIHKKTFLSSDRIQVIDVTSGLLQRMFGLVSVEIKTASQRAQQAKLSAVSRREAEELKEILRKTAVKTEDEEQEEYVPREFRLSNRDLLITASTSGRLGMSLSIVGAVFSQIDQIISEEQMVKFIESMVPAIASIHLVVYSIIIVFIFSWLLTFFAMLIQYGNFTLKVYKDELVISRGIIERKQLTVPFNRVQAIQIKEELLRQPFGFVSLILDSAGHGDENGRSVMLYPLLKKDRLGEFLTNVIPDYDIHAQAVTPPSRSLRRYLFRMVLLSLPVISLLWYLIPGGPLYLFLIIPALLLGYAQYRDAAIGIKQKSVMMRYRLLSRTTVIIKKYRIQSSELQSTYFQRRKNLVNFSATVASGNRGESFKVRDLDLEAGQHFWDWTTHSPGSGDLETVSTVMLPA